MKKTPTHHLSFFRFNSCVCAVDFPRTRHSRARSHPSPLQGLPTRCAAPPLLPRRLALSAFGLSALQVKLTPLSPAAAGEQPLYSSVAPRPALYVCRKGLIQQR
eukprot:scaffold180082_cov32-Tisochrysis_lutea.AAC.1